MLSASLRDVATAEGNVRRLAWTREVETLLGRSFSGSATSEPEWGVHWVMGPRWASELDDPARVALSICELTMETELHVGWYLRQQGTACLARGAACDRKGTIEIGGIATLLSNSRKVVMSVRRAM